MFPLLPTSNILTSISVNQNTKTIWNTILNFTLILWVSIFISKSFPNISPYSFPLVLYGSFERNIPLIKSFTFVTITNHRRRQKKEGDEGDE